MTPSPNVAALLQEIPVDSIAVKRISTKKFQHNEQKEKDHITITERKSKLIATFYQSRPDVRQNEKK